MCVCVLLLWLKCNSLSVSSLRDLRQPRETRAADLHPLPDSGAREGVPLQPVPHAAAADRDRARALPHGAADQDLVPEPEDEVEEGEQADQLLVLILLLLLLLLFLHGERRRGRGETDGVKAEKQTGIRHMEEGEDGWKEEKTCWLIPSPPVSNSI